MTSTDELERLLAEAQTDEPWTVVWYGDDSLPAIAIHRSTEDRICFMPTIQHPADGVQFEANAALICAAVNALPELLAIKAERDRAQRACEQMGQRITELENSLREIGAAIINGASDTLWMGDQISDETVVDFICNLTGDDPSLLGTFARAALNQETGSFTDDPFNRAVLGLPLKETGQ